MNKISLVPFGTALESLKQGKRVAREGWNGKGMFVFMRPADKLSVDLIVNQVKSLPQSVKDYFNQDYRDNEKSIPQSEVGIVFKEYMCMATPNEPSANGWMTIVNGWLASQTDMLSEDWVILD